MHVVVVNPEFIKASIYMSNVCFTPPVQAYHPAKPVQQLLSNSSIRNVKPCFVTSVDPECPDVN